MSLRIKLGFAFIVVLLPLLAVLVLTTYLVTTGKAFAYYKDFLDAVQWLVFVAAVLVVAGGAAVSLFGIDGSAAIAAEALVR